MGKTTKLLLALLTVAPIAYVVFFMATVARFMLTAMAQGPAQPGLHGIPPGFGLLFVLHVATMAVSLGLTIFYVVQAYRSPRVPESRRSLWVVLNIFGGFIAQLIYWYLFIWREPEVLQTTVPREAKP